MTTYQPTTYVVPGYPVSSNRPRIRLDCSYLGTKPGLLKITEVILNAIGAISFLTCIYFNYGLGTNVLIHENFNNELTAELLVSYISYRVLSYSIGLCVNILMWSYLLHIVERYPTIPWYTIEYIVNIGCCLASIICGTISIHVCTILSRNNRSVDTEFIVTAIFAYGTALVFIYNIFVVYTRKNMKIPPQVTEPVV